MPTELSAAIAKAAAIIEEGGVIIAPTEGVYGFSCRIDDAAALQRILQLKGRACGKGFITLCAISAQALALTDVQALPDVALRLMHQLWPGPHTFVLPCKPELNGLLTGFRHTLALRVPSFTLLTDLLCACACPLVSTSANLSGYAPYRELAAVTQAFGDKVDYILPAPCQGLAGPTSIHDGLSGRLLRQGGC